MISASSLCRAAVAELEGGVACCVYILNEDDAPDSMTARRQAISGLFASHTSRPEHERELREAAESALLALGWPGQARLAPDGTEGLLAGEFFLACRLWHFARILPEKQALILLSAHPSSSPNQGWSALNTAATRLASIL